MIYRLAGALACVIVALDCFAKNGGELYLPYWLWAVLGVCWLFNAIGVLAATKEAA